MYIYIYIPSLLSPTEGREMFSHITTCHVCAVAKADASTDTVCLSLSLSLMCEYEHARHVCCPVPLCLCGGFLQKGFRGILGRFQEGFRGIPRDSEGFRSYTSSRAMHCAWGNWRCSCVHPGIPPSEQRTIIILEVLWRMWAAAVLSSHLSDFSSSRISPIAVF